MQNPFSYTKIVEGESFCNRREEQKDLKNYIQNSQNILLHSYRRMGKTSLIHKVLGNLNRTTKYLYIDLYGTLTEKDFIAAIVKNLGQIETTLEKLIHLTKDTFKLIKLSFSIDPQSKMPTVTPSFDYENKKEYLDEIMETISQISEHQKLVVVFDEFQEIANYAEGEFEKRLRKIIQNHQNISYIFSGSRRHLLWQMFNSRGRAFYKLAESYPLPEIKTADYLKWATKLFKKKKLTPDKEILKKIFLICENHPMHVQRFLYHLWEEENFSEKIIREITTKIINRHQDEFLSIWNSLSQNQRKVLKLIVKFDGQDIFSAQALESVGLRSGSQVTKALEVLNRQDLIFKNHKYHLQDAIFKYWLKNFLI